VDARNKALANALVRPFDDTPDTSEAAREMAARLVSRDQAASQAWRSGMAEALSESWPAELAKSAYGAVTLPGDVYAGKVNPMSDEAVGRAFELAGLVTGGAGAMPAGRNEMRMGIKAYHGSPHDFDRFDMSKIGTGEGAQAYGHGLYFAGNEGVAKGYRDALKPGKGMTPTDTAARAIDGSGGDVAAALKAISERIDDAAARGIPYDEIKSLMQAKNILNIQPQRATGRMYEVDLNTTPDRLLDWDKPLSGQPQAVRDALFDAYKVKGYKGDDVPLRDVMKQYEQGGIDPMKAVSPYLGERSMASVYPELGKQYGSQTAASQGLRERGIDGIKYLDAGSRAAGDGSRNYVMFDDKLISILRKYGVATAAALPAAALAELGLSRKEAERTF